MYLIGLGLENGPMSNSAYLGYNIVCVSFSLQGQWEQLPPHLE